MKYKKMRNRLRHDEFYWTEPSWETKEIDGVQFVMVLDKDPKDVSPRHIRMKWMRKDSLETVK